MRAQNVFCRKGQRDNFVFREWGVYGLFLVILPREIIRYHDTEGRGSRCPTSPPSSRCAHDEQGGEGMWIYEPTTHLQIKVTIYKDTIFITAWQNKPVNDILRIFYLKWGWIIWPDNVFYYCFTQRTVFHGILKKEIRRKHTRSRLMSLPFDLLFM